MIRSTFFFPIKVKKKLFQYILSNKYQAVSQLLWSEGKVWSVRSHSVMLQFFTGKHRQPSTPTLKTVGRTCMFQ